MDTCVVVSEGKKEGLVFLEITAALLLAALLFLVVCVHQSVALIKH